MCVSVWLWQKWGIILDKSSASPTYKGKKSARNINGKCNEQAKTWTVKVKSCAFLFKSNSSNDFKKWLPFVLPSGQSPCSLYGFKNNHNVSLTNGRLFLSVLLLLLATPTSRDIKSESQLQRRDSHHKMLYILNLIEQEMSAWEAARISVLRLTAHKSQCPGLWWMAPCDLCLLLNLFSCC